MTLQRNPRRRGRGAALFALGLLGGHLVARLNIDGQGDAPTQHSRRIVDNAGEAIISADEFSRVVLANPAAAAMFGVSVAQMLGQPLARFIRAPADAGHSPLDHFQGGRSGRRSTDYAGVGIRPNGTFPIEGSITDAFQDGVTLYTIILRDVSERQRVQQKLARSHDQLRQLSAALQTIREEERTHISRELHDDLGQLLASLRMDLTLLRQAGGKGIRNDESAHLIAGMDANLLTAITSLRRIASNLRPRALDEGGLYFALRGLREDFVERHGIACELLADEAELRLDDGASTTIFRIVQEALTNVARHAQARHVMLTLYRSNGELLITIRDDGRGIIDADMEKAESLGLVGMRERVWALKGDISIGTDNGSGTRIDIVLPIVDHIV